MDVVSYIILQVEISMQDKVTCMLYSGYSNY